MTDANEITHALRLWFQAGDVFEVRVLDAVSADYRREHIESGYFDYEHISAVPEALKRLVQFELGTRLRAGQGSRDPRRAFLAWLG